MVTNAQGNVKDKAGRLLGFHDFAPHFEPPEEPIATEEDMKRMFRIKD